MGWGLVTPGCGNVVYTLKGGGTYWRGGCARFEISSILSSESIELALEANLIQKMFVEFQNVKYLNP